MDTDNEKINICMKKITKRKYDKYRKHRKDGVLQS